jgi:hypothetical protein
LTATTACSSQPSRMCALQRENDQLREALDSRAVIDQAKGALILRYGLDDDAAFALLRRWSQTSNTKVRTIAETLIKVCRDGSRTSAQSDLAEWLEHQVCDPLPEARGRTVSA